MNMILKLIAIGILAVTAACNTGRSSIAGPVLPESDDPEVLARQYRESSDKWAGRNLRAYTMVFRYGAFSPIAGLWEIDVVDKRVTRRVFEGEELGEDSAVMQNMNMERLFEYAAGAGSPQRDGPFIIRASFFRDGGVASVRRVKNPSPTAPRAPTDATWAYTVSEIRPLRK